jgi:hypothetical protein
MSSRFPFAEGITAKFIAAVRKLCGGRRPVSIGAPPLAFFG